MFLIDECHYDVNVKTMHAISVTFIYKYYSTIVMYCMPILVRNVL